MKNIFHFIDSGGVYGAESVILNLSREMLKNPAYRPVVGCIVSSRDEQVELFDLAQKMGIKAEKIVINNFRFLLDVVRVASTFRKMDIDLIHSHGYKPSVVGFIAHLMTSIPFIATCHLWYLGGDRPFKQKIMTKLELFLYKYCRHVIGVSQPIKDFLMGVGVSAKKVSVIKNGIYLDDFREMPDENKLLSLRKKLDISDDALVLVNTARLTEQKAQHNLILAAKELKEKQIKAVFLIVGEGELRSDLEKEIEWKNLSNEVRLLGFCEDVKELLFLADGFVLPSYDEGLPISLLEAMACKCPTIVTPVGDIPDIAVHNETARVIPVDDVDAIVENVVWLWTHVAEREKMAEKAFQRVDKHYSSAAMWAAYEKMYTDLLSNKKPE